MKYFEPAAQPALVLFGVWQNEQVGPSLRWPAWNVGATPSAPWQFLHLLLSTIERRAVKPVAVFHTSGGGTLRPPCALPSLLPLGTHEYGATFVCTSGG